MCAALINLLISLIPPNERAVGLSMVSINQQLVVCLSWRGLTVFHFAVINLAVILKHTHRRREMFALSPHIPNLSLSLSLTHTSCIFECRETTTIDSTSYSNL